MPFPIPSIDLGAFTIHLVVGLLSTPVHTRVRWVQPFMCRCFIWAELAFAAFLERTNEMVDVKPFPSPKMHMAEWRSPHNLELCLSDHRSWVLQVGHRVPFFDANGELTTHRLGWQSCQITNLQMNMRWLYYHILSVPYGGSTQENNPRIP